MSDSGVENLLGIIHNEDVDEYTLNDLVNEVKDQEAAYLNASGWRKQIKYLLDSGLSEEDIAKRLRESNRNAS